MGGDDGRLRQWCSQRIRRGSPYSAPRQRGPERCILHSTREKHVRGRITSHMTRPRDGVEGPDSSERYLMFQTSPELFGAVRRSFRMREFDPTQLLLRHSNTTESPALIARPPMLLTRIDGLDPAANRNETLAHPDEVFVRYTQLAPDGTAELLTLTLVKGAADADGAVMSSVDAAATSAPETKETLRAFTCMKEPLL